VAAAEIGFLRVFQLDLLITTLYCQPQVEVQPHQLGFGW
jgi:hypothetical protein